MTREMAERYFLAGTGGAPGGHNNSHGPLFSAPNAYGMIKFIADDGQALNVICTHGGSMWLCPGCAETLWSNVQKALQEKTGIERYFEEQT